MTCACFPVVLLLAGVAAPAPPTEPLRLTVDEAVARAVAASPRLGRLSALEAAAAAEQKGADAERWPRLDLTAGYSRRSEVPELAIFTPTDDPMQPVERVVVFPNIQDNWRVRAGVAWPLYTGGRVSSQIEAARQGREAADLDLDSARADLVLETKSAYWTLVTGRESARVLQEAIRAFDAHLEDARNRQKFGLAAANEVLAVQVEKDRAELDLEALVSAALAARPDRGALAARVSAASALTGVERGARLPQLAVVAGYDYANPNRDIVPPTATWKDTWNVGVNLSWSVFDGGRRSAGEARAQAQADAAREQLRELDRGIRLEVTQQVLGLRTARARVEVAERSVESATENRRVARERYREGVIPSSELLDAEVALEHAQLARSQALAALRLAAAGLDRAVGR
jgi:outer membrane protein